MCVPSRTGTSMRTTVSSAGRVWEVVLQPQNRAVVAHTATKVFITCAQVLIGIRGFEGGTCKDQKTMQRDAEDRLPRSSGNSAMCKYTIIYPDEQMLPIRCRFRKEHSRTVVFAVSEPHEAKNRSDCGRRRGQQNHKPAEMTRTRREISQWKRWSGPIHPL